MIKHLLFDCDGVLVDTEIVAALEMVQLLTSFNIDIGLDDYLDYYSGNTFSYVFNQFFGESVDPEKKKQLMRDTEKKVAKGLTPIQGVGGMLDAISLPKSVVSNSDVATVKYALKKSKIEHHFEGQIFSAELVERGKPSPDVYQLAIQELRIDLSGILVVEDSISGISAAKAAGLDVIGFTGASHIRDGYKQKLADLGVGQIASSMPELTSLLQARIATR